MDINTVMALTVVQLGRLLGPERKSYCSSELNNDSGNNRLRRGKAVSTIHQEGNFANGLLAFACAGTSCMPSYGDAAPMAKP